MKKYLKYKIFIPKEFVEKKQLKESKENRRGYKILLLLNIILLVFNMESISKRTDDIEYIPEPNRYILKKKKYLSG